MVGVQCYAIETIVDIHNGAIHCGEAKWKPEKIALLFILGSCESHYYNHAWGIGHWWHWSFNVPDHHLSWSIGHFWYFPGLSIRDMHFYPFLAWFSQACSGWPCKCLSNPNMVPSQVTWHSIFTVQLLFFATGCWVPAV